MNEMKAKALEKLMMILDEVLGEDVAGRMKQEKEGPQHEKTEGSKTEGIEDVLEEAMGKETPGEHKKTASGGASILALPEVDSEEMPESENKGRPKGLGIEVKDVKVAAMPRPGLMKRMHGGKKPA